jgi:hypothetical protein
MRSTIQSAGKGADHASQRIGLFEHIEVASSNAAKAETLARDHTPQAAVFMLKRAEGQARAGA